jgi:predicted amidohydrolase YtcJ
LAFNARFGDGSRHGIVVSGGRIAAITGEDGRLAASETIDLGGELVVPGFVEGHIISTPASTAGARISVHRWIRRA